jgi:HD-GYP domain-containing protein (c-di-GMP phosphodiesterase class II)
MKSKQQPAAGGDFHCLKNGTPSNGAVMNYLLGDEPDVAETSAELAKKLGLPEDLIKALGGK